MVELLNLELLNFELFELLNLELLNFELFEPLINV
jgi:hypothetical protein